MNKLKIQSMLDKHNKGEQFPTSFESFVDDCKRYIKATKENRLISNVDYISQSGMKHHIKFVEMSGKYNYLYNFNQMLEVFGFTFKGYYMVINGGNMDMVFNTHYSIIRDIMNIGIITKKTCRVLEQKQPNAI